MNDQNFMQVGFGGMEQATAELAMHHGNLMGALEELDANLRQSLAHWSGSAQAAYAPIKAQWSQGANEAADVVRKAQIHMQNTHDNYVQTENANRNLWA